MGNIQQIQDQRSVAEEKRDTQSFAYDDLYRLTRTDYAAGNVAWTYDNVGNIVSRTNTFAEARLQAQAMRYGENGAGPYALTSADEVRYAYDNNGRLTNLPHRTLAWDAEDRLVSVTKDDNTLVTMVYGFDGNRAIKRVQIADDTVETLYVDPSYEVRGAKAYHYIWADGKRIARVETLATESGASLALMGKGGVLHPVRPELASPEHSRRVEGRILPREEGIPPIIPVAALSFLAPLPVIRNRKRALALFIAISMAFCTWGGTGTGCGGSGQVTLGASESTNQPRVVYYLSDHLGSANLLVDSNGNILREEQRYPYGLDRRIEGTATADYVYTGKELDEETGLIYFGGRYYVPELGRWASPDPLFVENMRRLIQMPREINLYAYGINNPENYLDHNGTYAVADDAVALIGGAAVGMIAQGVSDYRKDKEFQWENYVGAAVGGAFGGELTLYSVNPVVGSAGAALVGAGLTQFIRHYTRGEEYDAGSLAIDTVIGGVAGLIPGGKEVGVTVGRNSMLAVKKQIITKLERGQIEGITMTTAGKMVYSGFSKDAFIEGSLLSPTIRDGLFLQNENQNDRILQGNADFATDLLMDGIDEAPLCSGRP